MLKHGILGLINYHEATGYEVMEMFRDSLNYFWRAHTSQIYRELQSLEKNKWVDGETIEQTGKPDKKVYHITEEGKEELKQWLRDMSLKPANSALLCKTFFLGELPPEETLPFFENFKACCEQSIETLGRVPEVITNYENMLDAKEKGLYWRFTVDYGLRNAKANKEWCEYCIGEIKALIKERQLTD